MTIIRSPLEPASYIDGLLTALRAFAVSDRGAADEAIAALAFQPIEVEPRRPVPIPKQARVFSRDRYCCRYCGARTVPVPVLRAVSRLWLKEVPYHSHWKTGATHPLYVTCSATIDHVKAVAHGGPSLSEDNLVTACYPHNAQKGEFSLDQLGWQLQPVQTTDWDGLVGYYPALWEEAQASAIAEQRSDREWLAEVRYHHDWLAAFAEARKEEASAAH